MYSSLTDSGKIITMQAGVTNLIKDTDSQESRSPSYHLSYNKTGTIIETIHQKKTNGLSEKKPFQQIAISEEINRLLRKASKLVTDLVTTNDLIEQTNLAFEFKYCLEGLWKNRDSREENWGDLLNILQAVLNQVEFERLSHIQKQGIKKVVTEYFCKADVADSDMEKALEVLSEVGFDPWLGISGNLQE